jgi:hypothetical protein
MKNALKELVKKHFNLVDAPAVEEEVKVEEQLSEEVVENQTEEVVEETLSEEATESTFAEIKTADGELTLTYEGEIGEGVAIFVKTEDGDIPAPDGTHALEGGITITTEGGVITAISEEEVEAGNEEEMSEEVSEETTEETEEFAEGESDEVNINELHEALIQMIGGEFKEQFTALKEELMGEINTVKEQFNAAPATGKTITNKKENYGRSNSVDISYNPMDSKKKAQFERLLKARNKN